jgi:Transposase IS4
MASTPLGVRRSARIPVQPHRLAEEQATHRYQAQELADLRRATEQSLAPDVSDESDEEAPPDVEYSSSEEEEEEKENDKPHAPWVEQTRDIPRPRCTEHPASNLPRHHEHSEFGYLRCFLPDTLISTIATNTTLYAASKGAPPGWATTPAEIWLFISVHIFMGIIDLPNLAMYWEEGWRQQYVVDSFSRNRFRELLRYFHIAEPTPVGTKRNVVEKIQPLWDFCIAHFPEFFTPADWFTLDETMVRFKGKSFWKTVLKGKPTPIGYKLYTLACLGYLLFFSIYKGKGGYAVKQGVIHHTVTTMVSRWSGSNRILFTDNLYTSPALCRHLLTMGIRSCGTFRPNRKHLPAGVKDAMKTLSEGETKAWQSGQLGCLVWCDKQPVLILSTHHRVDDVVSIQQNRGPSQPPVVIKPQVAVDYNVGKTGVDTVDQLRQSYAMQRKSRKDWPSLAWWLIDICIINSYTLWRLDTQADINQLDFRRTLLHQIPAAFPSLSTPVHLAPSIPLFTTADGHWPKHSHKKRKCVECSMGRAGGRQSEIVCERCNVHLCLEPCFKQHHVAHGAGM